ncbi:MAG: hypothetical protein N2037_10365 [Acidimicrobiales bacterium]|nr:hypothetical protein [Acidimicrobiales bacterium]
MSEVLLRMALVVSVPCCGLSGSVSATLEAEEHDVAASTQASRALVTKRGSVRRRVTAARPAD